LIDLGGIVVEVGGGGGLIVVVACWRRGRAVLGEWTKAEVPMYTYHTDQSAAVPYTSTHFIAMRASQRRFQAIIFGLAEYFATEINFFVASLAPYLHFHKETRISMNK
jgi:hypothetical protein